MVTIKKHNAGFTLIELVVVIALIGVAASVMIALVDPVTQFKKTHDARRKADVRQIQSALELYRADQGAYPAAMPACGGQLSVGTAVYIQKIPCDPKNTGQFTYRYTSTGTTYSLFSCLENTRDPDKDGTNNTTYCAGGTTNWSYTVANP